MTPEYPEHVSKEMCALRHVQVESDIQEIKTELKSINSKLWGGLVLGLIQVMGVLTIFIKGCAA